MKFVATKKGMTKIFFTPLSCCCFWIRDPGSGMGKNQDPGSGINIRDPHCSSFFYDNLNPANFSGFPAGLWELREAVLQLLWQVYGEPVASAESSWTPERGDGGQETFPEQGVPPSLHVLQVDWSSSYFRSSGCSRPHPLRHKEGIRFFRPYRILKYRSWNSELGLGLYCI